MIDCLQSWLTPNIGAAILVIGPWKDGKGMEGLSFLSVSFDGGSPPGPAERYVMLDLWYASPTGYSAKPDGQLMAYREAAAIEEFLEALTPERPFSNVRCITGIIGPKEADGGRLAYKMTVEITI